MCAGFGGDFGKFHLFLYDVSAKRLYPLAMRFRDSRRFYWTSFGNSTVQVLPAPHRSGPVLVVTMFVFSGPLGYGGEIIYYTSM